MKSDFNFSFSNEIRRRVLSRVNMNAIFHHIHKPFCADGFITIKLEIKIMLVPWNDVERQRW